MLNCWYFNVDRLLCLCFCLIESVKRFPHFKKNSAHRTAKSNYVITMLDRVLLLLVCVCSIKGGKGGWCPQQGWQPVCLLTIAQNHVHHSFTSAPCPDQNSNNILCFSYRYYRYFSWAFCIVFFIWLVSGKNNYLIVSKTMQRSILICVCAFFFLFEKNIAEKYLDGKVGLLLTFLF